MPSEAADGPACCLKRPEEPPSDIARGSRQQDERPMIHAHGIPQLALQVQIGPLLTSAIGQLLMSGRCLSTEMCQVQE